MIFTQISSKIYPKSLILFLSKFGYDEIWVKKKIRNASVGTNESITWMEKSQKFLLRTFLSREREGKRNTQKKIAPEFFKENQSVEDNLFREIDVPPNNSDEDSITFSVILTIFVIEMVWILSLPSARVILPIFHARERRAMFFSEFFSWWASKDFLLMNLLKTVHNTKNVNIAFD